MTTHYFASHRGGIEIVAEQLYHEMARNGQEVTWIAGNSTAPPGQVGKSRAVSLNVFNFVEKRMGLPLPIPTVSALVRMRSEVQKADVVVLHDCLYFSNIAVFLIAKSRGIPTLVIQHVGFVPYKNPLLRLLMKVANSIVTRPMLSRASQVVFISETTRGYFGKLRFKEEPELIFNGVDTELYRMLEPGETKSALRRDYGIPEGQPTILFVGRFVEKKGLAILEQMVSQRPNYTWAFAGWGPLNPGQWNAPNVRVFSGLRNASLAALYRACDVFVLPSTGEGLPLVVQEALASGLPVVCGYETSIADSAMARMVRGIPIYPGDDNRTADEFLTAVDEALNPSVTPKGGSNALREFAISRYSWRSAIEQYAKIMSNLTQSTNGGVLSRSSGRIFSDS